MKRLVCCHTSQTDISDTLQ